MNEDNYPRVIHLSETKKCRIVVTARFGFKIETLCQDAMGGESWVLVQRDDPGWDLVLMGLFWTLPAVPTS